MSWPEVTYFDGRPAVSGYNLKKHPLYSTWKAMRQRCQCKTYKDYPRYGGRGISVCKRWDNPNGDGTFFTKYGLTEKEAEMLVISKMEWREV